MRTTKASGALRAIGLALATALALSCGKHATLAECSALYDRFLDLKLADDPRAKTMGDAERAAARKALEPAVASDSDVQQVTKQCETEVTRQEYDCAIRASTAREWNDCIY